MLEYATISFPSRVGNGSLFLLHLFVSFQRVLTTTFKFLTLVKSFILMSCDGSFYILNQKFKIAQILMSSATFPSSLIPW